jgi:hypothetical protein
MQSLHFFSVKNVISSEASFELKEFLLMQHRRTSALLRGIHKNTAFAILDLFVEIDAGPIDALLLDWSDISKITFQKNVERIGQSGFQFWNEKQKYIFEIVEMLVELENSNPEKRELFLDDLELEDRFTFIALGIHMWRLYEALEIDSNSSSPEYIERRKNLKKILKE